MAKLGSIVPLIVLFFFIAVIAAVGFVAYSIAHDVGHKTREKLELKNVSFSRDGMKVGVKEVSVEQQEDKTQSVLMKVWNSASWASTDPKLVWSKGSSAAAADTPPAAERRNPFSRQSSGSQQAPNLSRHGSSSNNLTKTTSGRAK